MNGVRLRWLIGGVVAALAVAPLLLGNFSVSLLNDIGIGALVALGLVLLTGVGGATSFGQAATGSTATVSLVSITSPSQATVHYEVLLLGTPLLKNQVGTAIYQDGIWKVAIASFCGLAYLEYPKGSAKLPAV